MTRVITALILIPLVVLALFKAPLWLLALLIALIAFAATAEYLDIVAGHHVVPLRAPVFFLTGLFFLFTIVGSSPSLQAYLSMGGRAPLVGLLFRTVAFLFTFSVMVFLAAALRLQPLSTFLPSAAMSGLALAYISVPLEHLLLIRNAEHNGAMLILYGLLVVWTGDTFALYAGRSFGKRPLAPRISPNKTWEGAIASFVGSVLLGTFLLVKNAAVANFALRIHLLDPGTVFNGTQFMATTPWINALLASASINVAAQLGDLAESAMKRGANLKDSGSLLPGHGGILDRIDALLFAAPVLWYYAAFQFIHY